MSIIAIVKYIQESCGENDDVMYCTFNNAYQLHGYGRGPKGAQQRTVHLPCKHEQC